MRLTPSNSAPLDVVTIEQGTRDWRRVVAAAVGVLAVFVGFLVWASSSPVGASPDDDYHLGSVWCPWPVADSGCDYTVEDGEIATVGVPESVAGSAACYAFHPEISAECTETLSDNDIVQTERFDDGTYPPGYYQLHRLLVGGDVFHSIMVMRVVNVVLGLGGLVLVAAFASRKLRPALFLAATVAWVPMGVYFIASNNPTSWAITGVLIYAAATIAAAEAVGWRRWAEVAMMVFGTVLAATSRADSAFYVFVVTLALWLLIPIRRQRRSIFVWSVGLTLLSLLMFLRAGQVGSLTDSGGWPVDANASTLRVLINNIETIPDYIAGMWGYGAGPGWFDTTLDGWTVFGMLIVAGGVVFAGAREIGVRKALASLVLIGAIAGIPIVSMTLRHVYPVNYYQPRYLLPLMAVFFLVWIAGMRQSTLMDRGMQWVLMVVFVCIAHAFALYRTIERFSVGVDGSLLHDSEWWPWGLSPLLTFVIGVVAMSSGVTLLSWLSFTSYRTIGSVREGAKQ
ncbi:MAG: DUF2142 domain-containing protein [Scrofimicrobium sp.]